MQSDFVVFVLFFKPVRLFFSPNTFSSRGLIIHFCNTRELVCNAVGSQKTLPPPSSLKSVKASASSTLANPLTCGAKEQALYHS